MFSGKARDNSEATRFTRLVQKLPDIDPEEIKRIRKKIEDGSYFSKAVTEKTAEAILREIIEE